MKALLISLLAVLLPLAVLAQPTLDTLWTHVYTDLHPAQPIDMIPSFDGGLVWTGYWETHADSMNGHADLIVQETDGLGNPLWTFHVEGVTDDTIWSGLSLCQTVDSCYLVLAQRHYQGTPDNVVFKLDRNGEELWRHGYRFSSFDLGRSITALEDSTYALCIYASAQDDTVWEHYRPGVVAKLNASGDTISTTHHWFVPTRVVAITGGSLLMGMIEFPAMTKLDLSGNEVWTREYYDVSARNFADVAENSQGYFVAGKSWAYGSDNFVLLHTGFDGEPITVRQFIPDGGRDERVVGIVRDSDNGFLLGGYGMGLNDLTVPMVLLKTDSLGARQWRSTLDIGIQTNISAFCGMPDRGCAMGGVASSGSGGGFGYGFLARFGVNTTAATGRTTMPAELRLSQNYPNPFNPTTEIAFDLSKTTSVKLVIHDVLGRVVATLVDGNLTAGHHVATFNGADLSSGVYFYTLKTAGGDWTRKMLLMK